MHFTRVDAQVLLLASPFIFSTQSSPADDTGYVYFAGLGAQCEDFEAGFQYSLRNKWWTPYMRFDPSFGTTPSSHGFLLATKRCNTKLLFLRQPWILEVIWFLSPDACCWCRSIVHTSVV